jgi:hypothetical protein
LKEQDFYVVNVDGIDWYGYQGFMTPAYLPHYVPHIELQVARKVLDISGRPFVRWNSEFGRAENTQWWYILKRGQWNIEDIKDKKKRWMIRQGKKNFNVRLLSLEEVIKLCPKVAHAAAERYKGSAEVETIEMFEKNIDAARKVPDVLEYIGCFHNDELVSFSENYIQDNAVWLAVIRHDPAYLNEYSSYGLMDGLLEYYLNEKKFDYVLDGCRSIHHKTQFQSHLIKVFDFTKEYAKLNVIYSNLFSLMVKLAYPFRNIFEKLSEKTENNFIANVGAVLNQEYIRKSCC